MGNNCNCGGGSQETTIALVMCCCSILVIALFLYYAYKNQSKFPWLDKLWNVFRDKAPAPPPVDPPTTAADPPAPSPAQSPAGTSGTAETAGTEEEEYGASTEGGGKKPKAPGAIGKKGGKKPGKKGGKKPGKASYFRPFPYADPLAHTPAAYNAVF